ncbi:MAG: HEPN domain-containing protein [Deltaproteobacteria bacterium]|nr:HEPN domain-containing protein [Deltaproteobacteria bacterium]
MKRPPNRFPPGAPEEWLRHAMNDLAFSQLGLRSEEEFLEQVCFHAQQAVEKSLKAVLLHKDISFPLTHDVEELVTLLRKHKIRLPTWAKGLAALTPYAVETRYPGYWEPFSITEGKEAVSLAKRAVDWAKKTTRKS